MKTAPKYLVIVGAAIASLSWLSVKVTSTEPEAEVAITAPEEKAVPQAEIGEDTSPREAYRRKLLQNEDGEIPPDAWTNAQAQQAAMPFLPQAWSEFLPPGLDVPASWIPIGPGNVGGRIRSIIVHPDYPNPPTIWVGAVSGGIWKTTNDGVSWSTTTNLLPNLNVGCMAIDPGDPSHNTLYAGTGEVLQGDGIYKTTDGGNHWTALPSTTNNPGFRTVTRLAICPTNSQLILAATLTGLFRTTDGGGTWSSSPTLPNSRWADVRFKPAVPGTNCIVGSYEGHAYYSTDYGATWAVASTGWSTAGQRRVELAYSRSNPSIVYASVEVNGGQLYRSTNGGVSYSWTGTGPQSPYEPFVPLGSTGASSYCNALWVDPTDPNANTVLVGGAYLHRTTQGGGLGGWEEASSTTTHPDHHIIVEDPGFGTNNNRTVFGGNDGGIYKTENIFGANHNVVWSSLAHDLAITQFYGGAGHAASGKIIGGSQDNGTQLYQGDFNNWQMMTGNGIGGDGGFCAVDQTPLTVTDGPYFYGEFVNLQICRSTTGGASKEYIWGGSDHPYGIPGECSGIPCAEFTAPFILDPNNRARLLGGGNRLWRTNNAREGDPRLVAWCPIKPFEGSDITAIAVAQGDSNLIWVGHQYGAIYYTTNGNPAPAPSPSPCPSAMPSWTRVDQNGLPPHFCTRITIGPLPGNGQPRKVYATFGGFNAERDNVWRTTDNGASWVNISAGTGGLGALPKAPVFSLLISPYNPNILYVGTEVGVFASNDGGAHWSPGAPNAGEPTHAKISELFWMGNTPSLDRTNKLVAVTFGRGMFTLSPPRP